MVAANIPVTELACGTMLQSLARLGRYQEALDFYQKTLIPQITTPSLKSISAFTGQLISGRHQLNSIELQQQLATLNRYYGEELSKLSDRGATAEEATTFSTFLTRLAQSQPMYVHPTKQKNTDNNNNNDTPVESNSAM